MIKNYAFSVLIVTLFSAFTSFSQTFTGTTGNIPDNSCDATNEFTTTVSGVGTIGVTHKIKEVNLTIEHTYVGDLDIFLLAPNASLGGLSLSNRNGGNGDNYTNTSFTPDATNSITTGTAPFTGDFLPEGSFSFFDASDAEGTWTLYVCDLAAQDIGNVISWSITFASINDDPSGAVSLTVGENFQQFETIASNVGATASESTIPTIPLPTSCGLSSDSGNYQGGDIWYTAIVPPSGNLIIETSTAVPAEIIDTAIAVYAANLITNTFTQITCNDDFNNTFSKIELTNQTPGDLFYIRAWEYNNNLFGTFKISAYGDNLTYVPDDNFETYLETHDALGAQVSIGDSNSMGNGIASDNFVFTNRINTVSQLAISGQAIGDLTGIEGFTILESLECQNNQLSNLDLSSNSSLLQIICNDNQISNLNLSSIINLLSLNCSNNQLSNIDVSTNTILTELQCHNNQLTSLDVSSNTNLEILYCFTNQISSLDLSSNPSLTILYCLTNQLTSLNLANGNNDNITELAIVSNPNLTCVTVDNSSLANEWNTNTNLPSTFFADPQTNFNVDCDGLTYIPDISFENYLETHDASGVVVSVGDPNSMGNGIANDNYVFTSRINIVNILNVSSINIGDLTGIEAFTALVGLSCSNNPITYLDVSFNTALIFLNSTNTQLNWLNIANGNNSNFLELSIQNNSNLTCATVDNTTIANDWNTGQNLPDTFLVSGQLQFNAIGICPPVNDLPIGAIALHVGYNFEQFEIINSNYNATASEITETTIPTPSCGNYNGKDLWYTVEIPDDGSVIIETAADNAPLFDSAISVYTGLPGNFTEISCDDDISNSNRFSRAIITGRTPGETIYARIWEFAGDLVGSIKVSAYRNPAISTYVPDDNFENLLETRSALGAGVPLGDPNSMGNGIPNDNYVFTSRIETATTLIIGPRNIADLTGIEGFAALEELDISLNQLTSLDVTNNIALTTLKCSNNQITSIDLAANPNLVELNLFNIQLTSLDVSANLGLEVLICTNNQLTSLNASSNVNLVLLGCNSNQLTSLNLPPSLNLTALYCRNNQLTDLDVSANPNLEELYCDTNQLNSLDLSTNTTLTQLECFGNQLTNLDVSSNTLLEDLYCYGNQINSLDVTNNTALTFLRCMNNQLNSLDLSTNTTLTQLECFGNQLTNLDLSNSPNLTTLECYNNQLTSLNIANGNNDSMIRLTIVSNPNLTCVTVDNTTIASDWNIGTNLPSFFSVDTQTQFNGTDTCPPVNNLPIGGISLSIGNDFEQFAIVEDNTNTTASEDIDPTIPNPTCSTYAGQDLWYIIEIPADGSVIIETRTNNTLTDTALAVYAGIPNSLTEIVCNDDINPSVPQNLYSRVTLTGRTPGETIYARVWDYQSNDTGTFKISAYSNPAVSTYVPDDNFENYLETHDANGNVVALGAINSMGNGIASDNYVFNNKINTVSQLAIFGQAISDLNGIEGFIALENLSVFNNQLTSLDVSNNTALTTLDCVNNQITSINLPANPNLVELNVFRNRLTSLDVSANTGLTVLSCEDNQLTSLDVSANTGLTDLYCSINQLTSLNVSNNIELTILDCFINQLTSLNIANGNNDSMIRLTIGNNPNLTCVTVDNTTIANDWNTNTNSPPFLVPKDTQTQFSANCGEVVVEAKAYLQGAFLNPRVGEEALMRDDLRALSHLPTVSPYDATPLTNASAFTVIGADAIVDWVWVELRDNTDNTIVIDGQSALLQRDGDIVAPDGVNPLVFAHPAKYYKVVVKHRNHLGIMTGSSAAFPKDRAIDFKTGAMSSHGTNGEVNISGTFALWAGNVNNDGIIQYAGTSPDTSSILSEVLNAPGNFLNFATYVIDGYNTNDINMDGKTQYTGTNPDSPFVLQNVLTHPGNFLNFSTHQILEQLPEN